jgi:hypothetical protein
VNRLSVAVRKSATMLLVVGVVGCGQAPATGATSAGSAAASTSSSAGILFDDFSYQSTAAMAANGWIIRDKTGWPGVPGAVFDNSTVKIVEDTAAPGNKLLEISATTDGATTHQTQICQARKFLGGTYGARVFFNDAPASGPGGDQVVETFYLISPYVKANDPNYSEVDNEYLPNGGWGGGQAFYVTTWATVTIQPWSADNASNSIAKSLQGWHELVIQAADQQTRFYLDGQPIATHGSHFYPRVPMSINFNLWFIDQAFAHRGESRTYIEDVDWVYHKAGVVMSPDQVTAAVAQLRSGGAAFTDTVRASGLDSPCDL